MSSPLEFSSQPDKVEVPQRIVDLVRRCNELDGLIESGAGLPDEKQNVDAHDARVLALAACGVELASYYEPHHRK